MGKWENGEIGEIGEIGFFGCNLQSNFSTLGRAQTSSARHSLIENVILFPLNPPFPTSGNGGKI